MFNRSGLLASIVVVGLGALAAGTIPRPVRQKDRIETGLVINDPPPEPKAPDILALAVSSSAAFSSSKFYLPKEPPADQPQHFYLGLKKYRKRSC